MDLQRRINFEDDLKNKNFVLTPKIEKRSSISSYEQSKDPGSNPGTVECFSFSTGRFKITYIVLSFKFINCSFEIFI